MRKKIIPLLVMATAIVGLVGCGGKKNDTAAAVEKASKMTQEELEAAAKEEMATGKFKVLGLTSILTTAVKNLIAKYDWLTEENTFVNNGYKDYTLLQALEPADNTYVADFALTQDERSIADYNASGILLNYVPKDYVSLGLSKDDTEPLKGIHFNKVFWTNTNFETVTGKKLYNIWQVAGTSADEDHLSKVSFQSPVTEQINMSFLLSCEDPVNSAKIEAAYESYYKKKWEASGDYLNAGQQWVTEFINNVSRWHSSDGTAMKETQLKDDWNEGYVYFGAFAKMKDAAKKYYAVDGQETDPILSKLIVTEGENKGKVCAMDTVKWDWDIDGFNGYFYTMDSQIINNAEKPYTACLFARYLLDPEFYTSTLYNPLNPNADGTAGNQYGYYYPGEMGEYGSSSKVTTNSYDWTKAKWKEKSIVESYSYLSNIKVSKVGYYNALVTSAQAKLNS
jgi:ABC-type Fe3+ transport system substrate-binding protein